MEKMYIKSLQIIKYGKIKSAKQYNTMLEYFTALNLESLRYITGKNFKEVIKLAEEVN